MENSGQITILPVLPDGIDRLSGICREAYLDHFRYLWTDQGEWYIGHSFSREALQSELEDSRNYFFIILFNGLDSGFLKLRIDGAPVWASQEKAVELERIYLLASRVGQGIGKKLLGFTLEFARQHHLKLVWLKAMDSSTDSIAFYRKNGFETCGTHQLEFPLMKEQFRGMVVMKKYLD